MTIEIKAGRRYVMRYGGITAPIKAICDHTKYKWCDGYLTWKADGHWYDDEHSFDLIAEYTQPEPLSFPLVAGGKYETVKPDGTAGPVVKLREGTIGRGLESVNALLPFNTDFDGDDGRPHYVTPLGEIYHHREGKPCLRIVRPYIAPPPTPIERLEKWKADWQVDAPKFAELAAIIADLKAVKP